MHSQYVYSLFDHGDIVLAGTCYDGMDISMDGGKSWQATSTSSMNIEAIASFDSVLLASQEYYSSIYRSADAGKRWTTIHLPADFVFNFANSGSTYFASTNKGVFISTDKGLSWNMPGSQLSNNNIFSVTYSGNFLFAGTGGGGLYRSSDEGVTWVNCSGIANNDEVYDLLSVGSRIYAATLSGVYASSNQGLDWEKHTPDGYGSNLGSVDSAIFASGSFNDNGSGYNYEVIKSTDNGHSWVILLSSPSSQSTYFNGFVTHGHDLYLGTNNGVLYTSDLGSSWVPFSDSMQNGGERVTHLATDGKNLYAGANPCGIWWRPFEAAYLNYSHQPIEFDSVLIGTTAETNLILENSGNLPLTIQGVTLPNQNYSLLLSSGTIAPGSSSNVRIRFTPTQLGEQKTELLFLSNAFNSPDSVEILGLTRKTNGSQTLLGLPATFHLENNYPNPFNSTTTILFGIPIPGHVQLRIYDIKGRTIASLLDEDFPAGNYECHWNAIGVASGIYFLRFQSLSFTATKKMLYLK
ncbi:MAG: T9SS type A sorting domain-containing protein [Bacteroidota bacterium]